MSSSSGERDCDSCVEEFMNAGGCDAMMDDNTDQEALIPEGCYHCGDEAVSACVGDYSFSDMSFSDMSFSDGNLIFLVALLFLLSL